MLNLLRKKKKDNKYKIFMKIKLKINLFIKNTFDNLFPF